MVWIQWLHALQAQELFPQASTSICKYWLYQAVEYKQAPFQH